MFDCPSCSQALRLDDADTLICDACKRGYPTLGGVWCLVRDPDFRLCFADVLEPPLRRRARAAS